MSRKRFNERSGGILNRSSMRPVRSSSRWWSSGTPPVQLSLRDLPKMFLIRRIEFSYEAVRDWETKLTPSLIDSLRRLAERPGSEKELVR